MPTLWLHIGAPKSGTTSLQHFAFTQRDRLAESGVAYIAPRQRSSCNPLAVALINNRRDEIRELSANIARKFSRAPDNILMSSEQFFGMAPELLLSALPDLSCYTLRILCYLRRQDVYIESKYLQKRKRGAFKGSIADFIERFEGSGSNYEDMIIPWENASATIDLRICEPARLVGGSVVTDVLHVMGVPTRAGDETVGRDANTSPTLRRLQLIDAAKDAGFRNIQRLQRNLPPADGPKARFLSAEDRRSFLNHYADSNERLRKRYHPDLVSLFSEDGLDAGPDDQPRWTDADMAEIHAFLKGLRLIDT